MQAASSASWYCCSPPSLMVSCSAPPPHGELSNPTQLRSRSVDACPTNPPFPPASPGTRTAVGDRPEYPALDGSRSADVVIIGGGFTGLSAAVHWRQGRCRRRADRGASLRRRRIGPQWRPARHRPARLGGRAGGANIGFTRAKALFDLAEEAKAHLSNSPRRNKHRHRLSCRARCPSRTRSAT